MRKASVGKTEFLGQIHKLESVRAKVQSQDFWTQIQGMLSWAWMPEMYLFPDMGIICSESSIRKSCRSKWLTESRGKQLRPKMGCFALEQGSQRHLRFSWKAWSQESSPAFLWPPVVLLCPPQLMLTKTLWPCSLSHPQEFQSISHMMILKIFPPDLDKEYKSFL